MSLQLVRRPESYILTDGFFMRVMRWLRRYLPSLWFFLLFVSPSLSQDIAGGELHAIELSKRHIPSSFFGLHIHRAGSSSPWPSVSFGSWRLWDTYAVWPWLEPRKGEWRFDNLDKLVAIAEKNRVDVLLPLGLSPAWASARPREECAYSPGFAAEPRNLEDWNNYVQTVASRYKGRVRQYEIWNEPNLKNFYSGTVEKIVTLAREAYKILKSIDPSVIVISPSATKGGKGVAWLDEYLENGGGDYADVIGFHFYTAAGPPEEMLDLIHEVKKTMLKHNAGNKPLWNTESGWFIANRQTLVEPKGTGLRSKVLSEEEASAYLARAYIINWAFGVGRFYWYAWDNYLMGLTEADGRTLKQPAKAYAEIQKWLLGARMTAYVHYAGGTWTCEITREGGHRAWIAWHPDKESEFALPREWKVKQIKELTGGTRDVTGILVVNLGPMPLLLESNSKCKMR